MSLSCVAFLMQNLICKESLDPQETGKRSGMSCLLAEDARLQPRMLASCHGQPPRPADGLGTGGLLTHRCNVGLRPLASLFA